ncbi:hypothetical protein K2173_003510 [Erythroxylum novogranatense]|uniref:Uncharacterized protein n=1 Tax=Erythroxylum novogranatense TaxID=1862640 RepID=A0AAV8TC81_9ROSI|nr:hypothetical protein K2173_003510 [Erythroxylum novogranatense]
MVRRAIVDKNGLKKGTWSREEDDKLRAYIQRYGCWNWRKIPKFAGLSRCGKSCRLRWLNYLRPGVKHGNFSEEEDDLIIQMHRKHGNKWSRIAKKLPGRTDNEIKNHWHTNLKKHHKQMQTAVQEKDDPRENSESVVDHIEMLETENSVTNATSQEKMGERISCLPSQDTFWEELSPLCCGYSSVPEVNCTAGTGLTSMKILEESNVDFWTGEGLIL